MLRIVIVLALVFAVVWYMLKDGEQHNKAVVEQVKNIDIAEEAVRANEKMSAEMAAQTDAIRDQIQGVAPQPAPEEEPAP